MGRALPPEAVEDILLDWAEDNGRYVVVYWTGIDSIRCRPFEDGDLAREFAKDKGRVFKVRTTFEEVFYGA